MSVCVVNLVELDPEANGGQSRIAREISQLLVDLSQEQAGFYPIFVIGDDVVARFADWIERIPVMIPVNRQQPNRPLVRGLNPDLILNPLSSGAPLDQIREFAPVRQIIIPPDLDQPYRQYLLENAPDIFVPAANSTIPSVSLTMALQELQDAPACRKQIDVTSIQTSSIAALPEGDLSVHLNYLDQLIQEEYNSVLGALPIIGLPVRAVIRLRNIGRFWRSTSVIAREIGRRQALLAARIMQDANLSSEDAR